MFSFLLLSLALPVAWAALENSTIDDQDFTLIDYEPASFWAHDPLFGYEYQFFDSSRSYTYTPGANATFTFTGSGIYLQGPYAPDQALRRVTLDGVDQGVYSAYAPNKSMAAVFWGKGDLVYATHTVVITHNDTTAMILALDAFLVEFDSSQTPLPFSTTTVTVTTSLPTGTSTLSSHGTFTPPSDNISKNKSYSNIIIGVVVPVLLLLLLCCLGLCIYRNRRSRTRQRKRDSFKEKLFRSRKAGPVYLNSPSASSPIYSQRRDLEGRPMSPRTIHTIASTHYSTAQDHPATSRPASVVNPLILRAPSPIQHGMAIHPTLIMSTILQNHSNTSMASSGITQDPEGNSPRGPTFLPPAEWRTTLTSSNGHNLNSSIEPFSATRQRQGSLTMPPSAWANPSDRPRHVANRPSTVFSETDSNYSGPLGGRPPIPPRSPQRPGVLRRFSNAIATSLTRVSPSRPSTPGRNSLQYSSGDRDSGGPGYFRGMNHFNLGIPLNYRPMASASPTDTNFPKFRPDRSGSGGANTSSGAPTERSTPIGSRDELAFLGYTQPQRSRSKRMSRNAATSEENFADDEKPEKILENFDGSTIRENESIPDQDGDWSIGHATFADNRELSPTADLARSGSLLSRQRSLRSPISDRSGQITPPPYTVLVPPDTKRAPTVE